MSKSLSAILNESLDLEKSIIESYGELTPAIMDRLTINEIETKEKLDAYDAIMDRFELSEKFFKDKAAQINLVAKAFGNARESMRARIKEFMIAKDIKEVRGSDVRYALSNTTPTLEIDEKLIAKKYWVQIISEEIDKAKIKEDLKAGVEIFGANLKTNQALKKYNIGVK